MSPTVKGIFLLALVGFVGPLLQAQQITYKPGEYPAPRYPEIPRNPTVEDLMPVAQAIVKRDSIGNNFYPGYGIKPGERALIAVSREYDPLVLAALQRAIREAGASVDVLLGDKIHPNSKDDTWHGDGSTEFQFFTFMKDVMEMQAGGIYQPTLIQIALAGNYNVVLSGQGGGLPNFPRDKMRWEYLPWDWIDKFMVNGANMPSDLLRFIDDATWSTLTKAVRIHATDPEGTDITWTIKSDDWVRERRNPGHLMSHPAMGGATGVIGGTWNHTGTYPHIRASFKDDRLEGLEGGGAYGQKWRAIRSQWNDVRWSGKPGPGLFTWLQEAALGTNPKSARPKNSLERARANTWERTRAGIIHWGIGAGITEESTTSGPGMQSADPMQADTSASRFLKAHPDTPTGHVHIHNYFLTMELTNADGSKTTLINKGRLTTLNDPRVRQEAAKYGDPDRLLEEDWIPAIPGINVPGDYWEDYANDPATYFRKDLATNWKY